MSQSFHASLATQAGSPDPLGLLADLPGRWVGTGFNVIARPNLQNNLPFFLELNATTETLEFTNLGGEATNRGSLQNDINLFGVHYLQQISDAALGKVHVEPGLWMRVPPTTVPEVTADTYVRQAVVPHGDAVLAQSTVVVPATANGMPQIDPLDSTPFTGAIPALHASPAAPDTDRDFLSQYTTTPLPPGLPAITTTLRVTKPIGPCAVTSARTGTACINAATRAPAPTLRKALLAIPESTQIMRVRLCHKAKNPASPTRRVSCFVSMPARAARVRR